MAALGTAAALALAAFLALDVLGPADGSGAASPAVSRHSGVAAARSASRRHGCEEAEPVPARWESVPNALLSVKFVSPSTGWALAVDHILATKDGGAHWQVLKSARRPSWSSLDFVDGSHGWVVGADALLSTSDGGRQWTSLRQPCPAIRTIDFVSPSRGFAIAGGSGVAEVGLVWSDAGTKLLVTRDGGRSWHRLRSPRRPESVCFQGPRRGFVGANGNIYATVDAGRSWTLSLKGIHHSPPSVAALRCAPSGAWAEVIGPGVASSHEPHIGYHYAHGSWTPIFAEQYFPHSGISVSTPAPGPYPAAFSAIDAATAAFVDHCAPCDPAIEPRAPLAIARDGGAKLVSMGGVKGIEDATSVSFAGPRQGWVTGSISFGGKRYAYRIVHTADGGRTWHVQYSRGR